MLGTAAPLPFRPITTQGKNTLQYAPYNISRKTLQNHELSHPDPGVTQACIPAYTLTLCFGVHIHAYIQAQNPVLGTE